MITNHWLEGVVRQPIPGGKSMPVRRCVVIHFTAGATAQSSINYWKEPKQRAIDLGAHIVIDRDGTIFQCRPFNMTISHAGVSRWVDPSTNVRYASCNRFAIGIELANAGNDPRVIEIAKRLPGYVGTVDAKHRNGGATQTWEAFPAAQVTSCLAVVRAVVHRYRLDDITSHDCIAPERKADVGPAFPLEQLRGECGFSGMPVVHWH